MKSTISIPTSKSAIAPRNCRDGEAPCVVCGRPIKLATHRYFLWVHNGGADAVTYEEGERLNATGHGGADLGGHPVGADCLRRFPELKPYCGVAPV